MEIGKVNTQKVVADDVGLASFNFHFSNFCMGTELIP